jgi:hypothetical protein
MDSLSTMAGAMPTEQQHMARLALDVVSMGPNSIQDPSCAMIWKVIVPFLIHTQPIVHAAAAAFGASYSAGVLRGRDPAACRTSASLNITALRLLQHHLRRGVGDFFPVLVSALLLAGSGSVLQSQQEALAHVTGVFSMVLLQQRHPEIKVESPCSPDAAARPDIKSDEFAHLHKFVESLDVHVSMFMWGRVPSLTPSPIPDSLLHPKTISDLIAAHHRIQQFGIHFIGEAHSDIYKERSDFTPEMFARQDRIVSWLENWLVAFRNITYDSGIGSQEHEFRHLQLLKAQALTLLIAVSRVRAVTQVSYDVYATHFEDIITCAENVLGQAHDRYATVSKRGTLTPFCPVPGIIHPLTFTARKCRHPLSRRRAIRLLALSGIEGPFRGDFEARVAMRIVEIEENRPFVPNPRPEDLVMPENIPDAQRVYLCWIKGEQGENDKHYLRVMAFSKRAAQGAVRIGRAVDLDGIDKMEPKIENDHDCNDHCEHEHVRGEGYGKPGEELGWNIWEEVFDGGQFDFPAATVDAIEV